jgi:phage terminase large subunit-like protein
VDWKNWPLEEKQRLLERLQVELTRSPLRRSWRDHARPKQLPPDDPGHHLPDANGYKCGCEAPDPGWLIHLFLAGRGVGKTWQGSNWLAEQAMSHPHSEWAVLAPSFRDVRKTCIEGDTGLLKALQAGELLQYRRNELQLRLSNGSVIYGYSGEQPERIRGANLWGAWVDELCSFRYSAAWYEGLIPALRIGAHPRVVVTSTPRPTALIRDLYKRNDGTVHITTGSTWENAANLSAVALAELRHRYEGTRLGRQELEGQLLEDIEGALWTRDIIDQFRVTPKEVPDFRRVVVAVDPSVTSGEDADACGIVIAAEGTDSHGYIVADATLHGTPARTMREAVWMFHKHEADCIVAEVNNGGDFVGNAIAAIDPDVPYRAVRASRGKQVRAQPVSALYEQGKIHHIGSFPQLEDELVTWTPEEPKSPNRLDALVWAVTELRGLSQASWAFAYGGVKCTNGHIYIEKGNTKCPRCGSPPSQESEAAV